jgi:hypothetical protein
MADEQKNDNPPMTPPPAQSNESINWSKIIGAYQKHVEANGGNNPLGKDSPIDGLNEAEHAALRRLANPKI